MDSVPIVAITGQVARPLIGTDAFQEADITGITMPVTKHNMLVTEAAEIPRAIAEAFHLAATGRPGPVLVDISKDALQAKTTFAGPRSCACPATGRRPGRTASRSARPPSSSPRRTARCSTWAAACSRREACAELRELAELTNIPVVTTLMALGAFPDSHPQHVGMPGMHGKVSAVGALQKSDLLITLGARFDDRVTGQLAAFAPAPRWCTPTSTPRRSARTARPTCRSWATARRSWST